MRADLPEIPAASGNLVRFIDVLYAVQIPIGHFFVESVCSSFQLQVMLEHVNLTVGERWEDNMTKFWYEVRKLGRDDVVELEQIRKGKVISDNAMLTGDGRCKGHSDPR